MIIFSFDDWFVMVFGNNILFFNWFYINKQVVLFSYIQPNWSKYKFKTILYVNILTMYFYFVSEKRKSHTNYLWGVIRYVMYSKVHYFILSCLQVINFRSIWSSCIVHSPLPGMQIIQRLHFISILNCKLKFFNSRKLNGWKLYQYNTIFILFITKKTIKKEM